MGLFNLVNRTDFDASGKPLPARCMVMKKETAQTSAQGAGATNMAQLMASIPIGLAEIDDKGKILTANSQFLELSGELGRGRALTDAIDADSAVRFNKVLQEAMTGVHHSLQFDCTFKGPRAAQCIADAWAGARPQSAVGFLPSTKPESKMLEAQLAQSQKMQAIGQLASGLAHDFNNMLTPILGFADLLLTKMRPTDPSFQDVMSIKQNANRAAGLVRHLLAFFTKTDHATQDA